MLASSRRTCSWAPGSSSTQLTRWLCEEHRREPELSPVLLHHLGGGPHVGVEAHPEVGQLRAEGGRGDQPGVAPPHQPTGGVTPGVVGPALGLDLVEGATSEDRPHPPAQQPENHRQHAEDHQGHQQGHDDLVTEVGLVGVADGPGRQSRPEVAFHPGRHRQPQQGGHGEGDQQPPGVAADSTVEGPRHHEAGEGRRIAQAVEADQPGGVPVGLGGQRSPSPTGRGGADHSGLGIGGRVELGLRTACTPRHRHARRAPPAPPGRRWRYGGRGPPGPTARLPRAAMAAMVSGSVP